MPKNNLAIGIVHEICPICGKPMNETIIMNSKLTPKYAKQVEEFNGKAIGYSANACEECAKYKDICTFCVSIDVKRSEPNNPYRTGQIIGLNKDYIMFVEHPEFVLTTNNEVSFCFMDEELGKQLNIFK